MFKQILLALAVGSALAVGGGMPSTASADWDDDDRWEDDDWDDDDRHWRHGRHGHHRHHGRHWHRRPIVVYPPVVIGGYYPARYYVGYPYRSPYGDFGYYGGPYYGYYGSGVRVSVGW